MAFIKRNFTDKQTARKETPLDAFIGELEASGLNKATKEGKEWLIDRAMEIRKISTRQLLQDSERMINSHHKILPGKMYMFMYDPKTKETLPYYDKLPIIFPIEKYNDGFLGINFHYLHPRLCLLLLDKLRVFKSNNRNDTSTRLKIDYGIVTAFAQVDIVKPTIHRYLYSQIRSRILLIPPAEWPSALTLPCEQFVGEKKLMVYKNSRNSILNSGSNIPTAGNKAP